MRGNKTNCLLVEEEEEGTAENAPAVDASGQYAFASDRKSRCDGADPLLRPDLQLTSSACTFQSRLLLVVSLSANRLQIMYLFSRHLFSSHFSISSASPLCSTR